MSRELVALGVLLAAVIAYLWGAPREVVAASAVVALAVGQPWKDATR